MTARGVSVDLYDETGLTRLAFLTDIARAVSWEPALDGNGSGTLELPSGDARTAEMTDRRIVKFTWLGHVFGVRVGDLEKCSLAVDGGRWIRFENLPGLRCLAGEGTLFPEYGLARASSNVRRLGHMSKDVDRSGYGTPLGFKWQDDPTKRSGEPEIIGVVAPQSYWIAASPGPDMDVAEGTQNWMYAPFTVDGGVYPDGVSVMVMMVFDNYGTGFLDDEYLFEATDLYSWKVVQSYPTKLVPGDHLIAAQVQNAAVTVGDNPLAFLCVIATLNQFGEVDDTSTVILRTDLTHWQVATVEPGFSRAGVMALAMAESQARSERGPSLLTVDFTATLDSNGNAISDSGYFELQVAQQGLDELAAQLTESGADCLVDHATMTLQWFNRYGSDLTSTVRLFLAGNLTDYQTTRVSARKNVAIGQLADGSWISVRDEDAITDMGGEVPLLGVDLGSTSSVPTAQAILTAALEETSTPVITVTVSASTLSGAQVGDEYWLGDTILIPGHRGVGVIAARCMGAAIDASGDVVVPTPRFVQDRSVA